MRLRLRLDANEHAAEIERAERLSALRSPLTLTLTRARALFKEERGDVSHAKLQPSRTSSKKFTQLE